MTSSPNITFFETVQPGKERVTLKHHAPLGSGSPDGSTIEQNIARGVVVEARENSREGRFSAAGGSDDAQEFTAVRLEADAIESGRPADPSVSKVLTRFFTCEHDRSLAETSKAVRHLGELLAVAGELERLASCVLQFAWLTARAAGDRFGRGLDDLSPLLRKSCKMGSSQPERADFCHGNS